MWKWLVGGAVVLGLGVGGVAVFNSRTARRSMPTIEDAVRALRAVTGENRAAAQAFATELEGQSGRLPIAQWDRYIALGVVPPRSSAAPTSMAGYFT